MQDTHFPIFIARRLYYDGQGKSRSSRPAVRVALAGVAIGVMIMIITVCVVIGFKQTVAEKVSLFGGHIQVVRYDDNTTFERQPVEISDSLLIALRQLPHIQQASRFFTKPGILKTESDFLGIVLRAQEDTLFADNLICGRMPQTDNEVVLSQTICRKLKLQLYDEVFCYFVGDEIRARKWQISGIYATGFAEADNMFVWCRPQVIRRLNGWNDMQASGVELRVDKLGNLDSTSDDVWMSVSNRFNEEGDALHVQTLHQLNPQIFAWLDLLDMNVIIIIFLMLCVSVFNIISGLIILILDSVRLIGTLKALGADNRQIRRIFIWEATMLVGRGVLWGNIIGLLLVAVQYFTHVLPLDPTSYYVNFVPVAFPWGRLLLLNIGIVVVSLIVMLAPSAIATRISPARVMRYD